MSEGHVDVWRGKRVDEMTREELIEALGQCGRMLQQSYLDAMHEIDVMSRFRAAKRR